MVSQVRRFNRIVTQRVGALDDRFLATRPAARRGAAALGDRGRQRCPLPSGATRARLRVCQPPAALARGGGHDHRREERVRRGSAWRDSPLPAGRASRAGQAQRRPPRRCSRRSARAAQPPGCVDGRGGAPDDSRARRHRGGRDPPILEPSTACARTSTSSTCDSRPDGIRREASRPASTSCDRQRGCSSSRRCTGADRLRRAEVPRRCAVRAQADVGVHVGARARPRSPTARGDGGPRSRAGRRVLRLETNGTLVEAIALYRSAGYAEVPAFNDEPYAHHWFEKAL